MRRQSPSGLAAAPTLKWGTHLGQVYETADDLRETLVPYFKAGLENNERCFWVTAAPLRAVEARAALREAVPNLDDLEDDGQIEILDVDTWYTPGAPLDPKALVADLLRRERDALDEGYEGLRTNGNCAWVEQARWSDFQTYETMVTEAIRGRRLICMCSYCFTGHEAHGHGISDVLERHDFLLPRHHHVEAVEEEGMAAGADMFVSMMESLPAAIYTTDADGVISYYNRAASDLWGYEPDIGVQRWCGMAKMFTADGAPLAHDHSPMALAVRTGAPAHGVEIIGERADGTRVAYAMSPTPLFDARGKLIGGINMLTDVSAQRATEERFQALTHELNHRVNNTLATVQAIMSSTLRHAGSLEEFQKSFSARIHALATTNALLSQGSQSDVRLRDLLEGELKVFSTADDPRVRLSGGDLVLPEPLVGPVGMAIHELATNAAKHGALSPRGGTLSVDWRATREAIEIRWRERDVALGGEIAGAGFGTKLLTDILPKQLGADIDIVYAADGVEALLRIPT